MVWKTRQHGTLKQIGLRYKHKKRGKITKRNLQRQLPIINKQTLIEQLKHQKPQVLYYDKRNIAVSLDGRMLYNKIEVIPHEKWVGCVSSGTEIIASSGGNKTACHIKVGDKLLSWDFKNNRLSETEVKEVFIREAKLFKVTTEKGKILCTPEHPFFVIGRGWVRVSGLQTNDVIFTLSISELFSWKLNKSGMYQRGYTKEFRESMSKIKKKQFEENPELKELAIRNGTEGAKKTAKQRSLSMKRAYSEGRIKKRFGKDNVMARKEVLKKVLKSIRKRPTKLEEKFIRLFDRYSIPAVYTGGGKYMVKGKNKVLVPDFKIIGKNKVIEVGSIYWHTIDDFEERKQQYKEVGFDCFTILEPSGLDEGETIKSICEFLHNGSAVLSIRPSKNRWKFQPTKKVYNFHCEPYNNYFTKYLLSHNSWSRTDNTIYIDDDVPMQYRKPLALHEVIEKFLSEQYRLDPNAEGHELSEEIERAWFVPRYGKQEWDNYGKIVERIHRKELAMLDSRVH